MSLQCCWANKVSSKGKWKIGGSGLTIIELLISCGLFILVTLTFFQIFTSSLQRSARYDEKHDKLQKFVVFKELMTRRIGNALLIKDRVKGDSIEFYLPYQVDSQFGRVNKVNMAQMVYWNEMQVCRIYLKNAPVGKIITEVGIDGERSLWNLGSQGNIIFSFETVTDPILKTTVTVTEQSNPALSSWEKSFIIYVRNFL